MTSTVPVSGAIEFQRDLGDKDGGRYFVTNRAGQGLMIPVRDVTPADLRALADHLELTRALHNGALHVVETRTEDGDLVAITLQDNDDRIVEVLYEAPDPRPGLDIIVARDTDGKVAAIFWHCKAGGPDEVLYRAPAYHCDPYPADYDAEGGQAGWAADSLNRRT